MISVEPHDVHFVFVPTCRGVANWMAGDMTVSRALPSAEIDFYFAGPLPRKRQHRFQRGRNLINARIPAMRSQALIGFCVFVIGIFAAYQLGGKISGGDMSTVEFAAFGFAAIWVGLTILRNWRLGYLYVPGMAYIRGPGA